MAFDGESDAVEIVIGRDRFHALWPHRPFGLIWNAHRPSPLRNLLPDFAVAKQRLEIEEVRLGESDAVTVPSGEVEDRRRLAFAKLAGIIPSMTVELPPAPSRALNQLMKSGAYASPVEAVAEGLRLLQQLLAGADQIRAGKVVPFDAAAASRIKAQGRKLLAAERRAKRASGR